MKVSCLFILLCSISPVYSIRLLPIRLLKHGGFRSIQKTVGAMISVASCIASTSLLPLSPANAVGPTQVQLTITGYKQVELCDGRKPIMPGQKAMEGLFPVCVEVDADVVNPKSTDLTDVSVYGFVKDDDAGNSVLPNNPDFKSDSGQYAMIKVIPPGTSHITYQFVAAVTTNPSQVPLGKLTFFKTKAVSFPGGDRFKALTECEVDPRAPGCSNDEDSDEWKL